MPNSKYVSGNRYEVKVCDALKQHGWYTWQTRGSKGSADVVALRHGNEVLLIQVKSGLTPISGNEWNAIYELAEMIGAIPVYAHATARVGIDWVRIMGKHLDNSPVWPGLEFDIR